MRKFGAPLCALALLISTQAQAIEGCGDLANAYGPFDYRNAQYRQQNLPVVEAHHFTPEVENLIKGKSGYLGGDIDYTLRAFPNHPRALTAIANLALRTGTQKPEGAHYSVQCYFDRAMRFQPEDGTVRLVYGIYLFKAGKKNEAFEQFKEGQKLSPNSPDLNYNLGLLYFDRKDYANAKLYAKKAYDLGFPLQGLKKKLQKSGHWSEA